MKIKQIFLIDDDVDDTEIFLEAFESMDRGFTYSTSIDPVESLQRLKQAGTYPDIIFLDINMPRLNGYEFLSSAKNTGGLKEVPVILISNPCRELIIPHIQMYDNVGYLSKPASFGVLKSSLKQVLDLAESR